MDVYSGWIIGLVLSITGLVAPAALEVTVSLNGTAVLPCSYTGKTTTMCWGRGRCPTSRCNDQIIETDGWSVISRKSDKYQLLGKISQGNVSLTITRVAKEDEGTYCCRVEISGLLNDQKTEVEVKIQEDSSGPHSVTTATTHHHPVTTEEDILSMLEECPDDED
ncbi:hepatitis A virus cellular receptor 2 homolog [Phyllobates terribilis]|uniref:hepatitis A virus cellular receptor 2 homolog n=1 Tax=Phyllobates terribilis TaxID=111132 RepID=UPI003CCAFB08